MRYIMALLLSLALAVPAFAGFEGPNASTGGFAGPGPQTITKAAQVQNALDDTTCTLEGNILERLSKNKYVFQDDSGKITVEIGQRIFGSNRVTPETRVRLTGEVDHKKQGSANEVDVRYLEIVKYFVRKGGRGDSLCPPFVYGIAGRPFEGSGGAHGSRPDTCTDY